MATKLTRLTHKIAIQLHLVAESCTISSSHSRRSVRNLLGIRCRVRCRNVSKNTHHEICLSMEIISYRNVRVVVSKL